MMTRSNGSVADTPIFASLFSSSSISGHVRPGGSLSSAFSPPLLRQGWTFFNLDKKLTLVETRLSPLADLSDLLEGDVVIIPPSDNHEIGDGDFNDTPGLFLRVVSVLQVNEDSETDAFHVLTMRRKTTTTTTHCGTKPGHFETSEIHFPTSEGVSEVSERANE